jgi:3-oxoacyl-[acyl-carrier-protein] synthase-3
MKQNSTHRYDRTVLLGVERVEAPVVVTSNELDERLAEVYGRPPACRLLEGLGRHPGAAPLGDDGSFIDGAVAAGQAAVAASGVAPRTLR